MDRFYKLIGEDVVECSLEEFAIGMNQENRRVARSGDGGGTCVSTVFLGLDHQYGEGPPLVFETMIFGGEYNEEQWRYSTMKEAREGHLHACKLAGIS